MATLHVKIPDPFIQTSQLHDEEENILHIAAIRLRVVGSGNLNSTLMDMDSVQIRPLAAITMAAATEYEPDVLTNFKSQRSMLKLGTTVINEIFTITKIIAFYKALWTEYPR